jgi:hypothetical protein
LVLTRTKTDIGLMRLTAEVLELAKRGGLPVPAHEAVAELSDGYVAVVQERLPGRRPMSGAARGDRRFAVIGTQFCLQEEASQYGVEPAAIARLDEIIRATIEPDLLRTFKAHWAAHNLHVSIENHFQTGRIEQDLRYAESIVFGPHYG